jgi:eukaryotic-like serine/threonine-protein kinase
VLLICPQCLSSVGVSDVTKVSGELMCRKCGSHVDSREHLYELRRRDEISPDPTSITREPGCSLKGSPSDLPLPCIERYQTQRLVGNGGNGHVYLAVDPLLHRDVALKIVNCPDERAFRRFCQEARSVSRLDHPNIVSIYDAGITDGVSWMALEYVAGTTLAALMQSGLMEPHNAVKIAREVAHALHYAHQKHVIHRDLKPDNILIDHSGTVKITDFGLARLIDVDAGLTREGATLGTPAYMSPEQAAGDNARLDSRSDIYSLGVILFEMLNGHRPWNMPSSTAVRRTSSHTWARELQPGANVPRSLRRICARALSVDRGLRFQTANLMARKLDAWLRRHESAKARRRYWLGLYALAAVMTAEIAVPSGRPSARSMGLSETLMAPRPKPPLSKYKPRASRTQGLDATRPFVPPR